MPVAKNKQASKQSTTTTKQAPNGQAQQMQATQPTDAVALLKADHRKVEQLFAKYKQASSEDEKQKIVEQICKELIIHAMIEEQILYPACREKADDEEPLDEAQVEHDGVKLFVAELMEEEPGDEFYDAKVTVLSEYVKHHVGEEEKPGSGIFAIAQKKGVDMAALGQKLQARKQQLLSQAEQNNLPAPRPRALHPQKPTQQGEMGMYRRTPDRDDEGRFVSEDERGYRSSSRGGSSRSRSRYEDDDDDYRSSRSSGRGQGGWFGDPEGHSQASERGWEDRGHSRSVSSRGGSSRSRYEDDDDRSSRSSSGRGRGHGGWFGDPEGHSKASERGWEDRGQSRSASSRGGSSRSRYEDDDDDDRRSSSGRGRGHGGWFGDPEGHSEAAERGWEDRGHSRSASSRGGSSRSRYEDNDDDRRGSSGRGRGHGGWFGDPEGHSEAAERGWEDRGRHR